MGKPNPNTDIKIDGKVVGRITSPAWSDKDNVWRIGLALHSSESRCGFRWARVKYHFDDELAARKWLNEHIQQLADTHRLYQFEDVHD